MTCHEPSLCQISNWELGSMYVRKHIRESNPTSLVSKVCAMFSSSNTEEVELKKMHIN